MKAKATWVGVVLLMVAIYAVVGTVERHRARDALDSAEYRKAVAIYERVRTLWPYLCSREKLASAYHSLGTASGDLATAREYFQKAEDKAPQLGRTEPYLKASAAWWQADRLLQAGQAEAAVTVGERAVKHYSEAMRMLQSHPELRPRFWVSTYDSLFGAIRVTLARSYTVVGKPEEALEVLRDGLANAPAEARRNIEAELALDLAVRGDLQEAKDLASDILSDERGTHHFDAVRAHYVLMLLARSSGDEETVEKEMAAALDATRGLREGFTVPKGCPMLLEDVRP